MLAYGPLEHHRLLGEGDDGRTVDKVLFGTSGRWNVARNYTNLKLLNYAYICVSYGNFIVSK